MGKGTGTNKWDAKSVRGRLLDAKVWDVENGIVGRGRIRIGGGDAKRCSAGEGEVCDVIWGCLFPNGQCYKTESERRPYSSPQYGCKSVRIQKYEWDD